VQLSEEAERKLADERMKEWSKDQEEYTERAHQEAERKRKSAAIQEEEKRKLAAFREEEERKLAVIREEEERKRRESREEVRKQPLEMSFEDREIRRLRKVAEERRLYEAEMEARIEQEKKEEQRVEREREKQRGWERKAEEVRKGFEERRSLLGKELEELNVKTSRLRGEESVLKRRCLRSEKFRAELEEKAEERKTAWLRRTQVIREIDGLAAEVRKKLEELD
jgi:hypothetical protein